MRKQAFFIPLLLLAFASCSKDKGNDTRYTPEPVSPVYRLLADYSSMDSSSRSDAYIADSIAVNAFMKTVTEQDVNDDVLKAWSDSRVVEVFTPSVDSVFSTGNETSAILGKILARGRAAGLEFPERHYADVIYGRPESILFVDSVMLIALNHYLGAEYPGYTHWPTYIRQTKTPEMLPYDIAEALVATEMPFKGDNATVLSRILYEGALAHIKNELVEEDNPGMALGYSPEQYKWLKDNERELWRSLVQNRLVYDTSESTIYKLVGPAPAVNILSPAAPGRAGRFLGFRIVESYLQKHPGTSAADLLSPEFYNSSSVLVESGY